MPINTDKRPTLDDMGWWMDPADADYPDRTMRTDLRQFRGMAGVQPARFTARAPRADVNPRVRTMIVDALKGSGWDDGFAFWPLTRLVLGDDVGAIPAQIIGSCVASSHLAGVLERSLLEVVLFGQPDELLGTDVNGVDTAACYGPYSYAVGRRKAGIRGGDGSTCSGQIAGSMEYGFLDCSASRLDEGQRKPEPNSSSLYRAWGNWRHDRDWWETGRKFDLVESSRIRDTDDAAAAISDGKPIQICSGWGFAAKRKVSGDGEGGFFWVYDRSGSWSHSMLINAWLEFKGERYFVVRNSWGRSAHKPPGFGVPRGSFIINERTASRWLPNANAMTIGELELRKSGPPVRWTGAGTILSA